MTQVPIKESLEKQNVHVRPEMAGDFRIAAVFFAVSIFLSSTLLLAYVKLWEIENRLDAQRRTIERR